jgi:bacteriocin biosynthesis cyclodehydratase domain-containing protein
MNDLSIRYRVPPSFSIVAHSPNVVELRRGAWNPVSITLTDQTGSGKLFRALDLMDGGATLQEVADRAGLTPADAKNLVAFLSRQDAVESEPQNALDQHLSLYRETLGAAAESRLRYDRLTCLGGPDLGVEMAEQLDDLGLSFSWTSLDPAEQERLTSSDFTLADDPLAFRKEMARFEGLKGSLVVFASMTVHPILLRNLNRVCLHHGIPWVHAVADGPYLIVGPTFVPGRSPCYECLDSRVTLSMRESESYARYKRALAARSVKTGKPHLMGPFRGLLASLAAMEVANLMSTGSNFTLGKALTLFLPTMEFSFNEVLRVPGCPACSPMTEQHEQGLYFDVKGYVNTLYSANGNGASRNGHDHPEVRERPV